MQAYPALTHFISTKSLSLVLHTRNEEAADSDDRIRLFCGTDEIGQFENPPSERGKIGLRVMKVDLDYEDFLDSQIFLALTDQDK